MANEKHGLKKVIVRTVNFVSKESFKMRVTIGGFSLTSDQESWAKFSQWQWNYPIYFSTKNLM